jgi:predicted SnoaL-like aldol condensation-catalyzing enzyme
VEQNKAKQAGLAYVDAINAGDLDALLRLFAGDARLTHPFGVYEGHEELSEFYGDMVIPAETRLTVHRVAAEGRLAVLEISALSPHAPETPQYAVDLFEIDDEGKVRELAVYYRNFDLG